MGVAKATPWRRSCTAKGLRIKGRSHSEPTISHLTASPIVSPWNTRMARRTACLRYVRICSFRGRYPCCVRVACRDDELASSLSRQEMAYPLRLGNAANESRFKTTWTALEAMHLSSLLQAQHEPASWQSMRVVVDEGRRSAVIRFCPGRQHALELRSDMEWAMCVWLVYFAA